MLNCSGAFCLLTTTFPGRSVHSPVKYVFFTVAYNIRPKFGRMFGTRSVSLPKPSASAECYSLTFGPSLSCTTGGTYCSMESSRGIPPSERISLLVSLFEDNITRHQTTFHNSLTLSPRNRLQHNMDTLTA